jgi:hypothetical protein
MGLFASGAGCARVLGLDDELDAVVTACACAGVVGPEGFDQSLCMQRLEARLGDNAGAWLDVLASECPEQVCSSLAPCLRHELACAAEGEACGATLECCAPEELSPFLGCTTQQTCGECFYCEDLQGTSAAEYELRRASPCVEAAQDLAAAPECMGSPCQVSCATAVPRP